MARFRTVVMETDGGRHFGIPAGLYAVGTRPHGGTVRGFENDIVFQTSTTEAFLRDDLLRVGANVDPSRDECSRSISAAFSDDLENYCEIIIHNIPWQNREAISLRVLDFCV